jgi:uncharacterized protein YlxW (UPF0749 family)
MIIQIARFLRNSVVPGSSGAVRIDISTNKMPPTISAVGGFSATNSKMVSITSAIFKFTNGIYSEQEFIALFCGVRHSKF